MDPEKEVSAGSPSGGMPEAAGGAAGAVTVRRYTMKRSQRNNWLRRYMRVVIREEGTAGARRREREDSGTRRRKARVLLAVLAAAVAVLAAVPLAKLVAAQLTVKNIEVIGECPYTAAELAEAAGIGGDSRLFSFDRSEAAAEACSRLSYLRSCRVSRKLPDTVVFTVSAETPVIYTEIAGAYYSLSGALRVLDRSTDPSVYAARGLVYAVLPETVSAVVGTELRFAPGIQPSYITETVGALAAEGLLDSVSRLYLDDRFDIIAVYRGRYRIRFGSSSEIGLKLATAVRIADGAEPGEGQGAVIDVSTPRTSGLLYVNGFDPNTGRE